MIQFDPVPTATGAVFRTGRPFTAKRYTIALKIDDLLFPEIHLHAATKRGARKQSEWLANNAAAVLEATGSMGSAYQRLTSARLGRPELPAAADTVYLTADIGKHVAGTPAIVMWSEWDEDVDDLNQYPVMALVAGEDQVPLAMDDFTTEKPVAK